MGEVEPRIGHREIRLELAEQFECQLVGTVPMLALRECLYIRGEVLAADGFGRPSSRIRIGAAGVQREEEQAWKAPLFIGRAHKTGLGFREVRGLGGARRTRGATKTDWRDPA